jgi:type I restriction enzyme S subunit
MSIAATVGVPIVTGIPACIHDGFVAIEQLRRVNQTYLLYVLKSLEGELRSAGQTGSQSNVNTEIVNGLLINLPPEPEQKRIAEVLWDADDQIATLERLLTKKQVIKQAMMQQLLTGTTRLPGFIEPWSRVRLGDIARIKTGTRNNQDKKSSGRYPFFVRSATVERIDTYSYDCEAILVPGEGGIGSIFHYISGKFEVHQRVYKISHFNDHTNGRFVYFYMQQFFGRHATGNSVKATVDSLRLPTFQGFPMNTPASVDEQNAVAHVLNESARQLEYLEQRLAKAKDVKQGMMQELLTGRTRLPVKEGA